MERSTHLGLPAKVLGSFAVIAVIVTLTVGATVAYFSGTENQTATISTATIDLDATSGFPLSFTDMLPGETQSLDVTVKNVGDRAADFYVQMLSDGAGVDFCNPNDVLDVRVDNLSDGWTGYNASICNLFPGWSGSTIAKIADNVAAGVTKTFRISVALDPTAGNVYQNASNADVVHLIAVQFDGSAPVPDNDGGATVPQAAWPNDPFADDDDPNYS